MKKRWQLWVGVAVSIIALVLALLGIDLRQMGQDLAQADYGYLLPAALSMLGYLVARSVRWRVLLGTDVSLMRCFWVTNVGYLVSNVLPLRIGDPARAVAIGVGGRVKVSAALSTVVVERVLDMLTVVLLLAATLPFVEQAGWMRGAGLVAGLAALGALGVMIAAALHPAWIRRFVDWLLSLIPRLDSARWLSMLDGLLEGLEALRSPRRFAGLLFWSIVSWAFVVGYYWGVIWAFIEQPPLAAGSFLSCAVAFGLAIPAARGAMGVFESVARYALELPFAISEERAVAVAFISHALQYVMANVLGVIGLARLGLSLGKLRADAVALEENG